MRSIPKPCLDCGTPTRGARCARCARRDDWSERRKIRTGWDWGKLRAHVHARDRVCVRCGEAKGLEVHHRVSLAHGGTNDLTNLELRCRRCHRAAHTNPTVNTDAPGFLGYPIVSTRPLTGRSRA